MHLKNGHVTVPSSDGDVSIWQRIATCRKHLLANSLAPVNTGSYGAHTLVQLTFTATLGGGLHAHFTNG